MNWSIHLDLLNKSLRKKEEGFSLVELVVVVAILAVLAAIAVPSFTCVRRRASATAALAAMKQIQKECLINKLTEDDSNVFTPSTLQDYAIQGSSGNSCSGDSGGLISAIPADTNVYPTFILATNTDELSYSFKGQTGTNFSQCVSFVCTNQRGGESFQEELEANNFVREDTYIERRGSCCCQHRNCFKGTRHERRR